MQDPNEIKRRIAAIRAKVPDATDDEILSFLEEEDKQSASRTPDHPLNAAARLIPTAAQGLPLIGTFTDEIAGSIAGALTPGMTMQEGRDKLRAMITRSRKEHPAMSFAAEMGAGMLGGAGLVKAAPKLAAKIGATALDRTVSLAQRVRAGLKGGAVMGTAAGAGTGEGGIGDRVAPAIVGGTLGAGVGAAAPAVIEKGTRGADWLGRAVRSWRDKRDPSRVATRELMEAAQFDKADLLHGDPASRVMDIADVNLSQRIAQAQTQPSEELLPFGSLLEQQAKDRQQRAMSALQGRLGVDPREGPIAAAAAIEDAARPVTKAARETLPIHIRDPRLTALLSNDSDGMKAALALVDEEATRTTGRGLPRDAKGLIDVSKITRVEHLDALKKVFDKMGRISPKLEDPTKVGPAIAARGWATSIRDILDERTMGKYGDYLEKAQIPIKAKQAAKIGERAMKGRSPAKDVEVELSKLKKGAAPEAEAVIGPQAQLAHARTLLQKIRGKGETLEAIIDELASPRGREAAMRAFPDADTFSAFEQEVSDILKEAVRDAALKGNTRALSVMRMPDTFSRLTPWSLAQAIKGSPSLAIAQAVGAAEAADILGAQAKAAPLILKRAQAQLGSPEIRAMLAEWGKMNAPTRAARFAEKWDRRPKYSGRAFGQAILGRAFGVGGEDR